MTTERRLERDLPQILGDLAMGPYPEYIDDVLAATAQRRQRPAWTFPERWLPMAVVTRRPVFAPNVPWRTLGALALLGLLVAAAVAAYVGSQARLPVPFGPARNGLIAYAANGDIFTADAQTGVASMIVSGPETDLSPVWSLDGTRLVFERRVEGASGPGLLYVAQADGTRLTRVTPEALRSIEGYAFSPDGREIVFTARPDGLAEMFVAASDGSAIRTLSVGSLSPSEPVWRPPDGGEIVFVGNPGGSATGLYAVGPTGDGLRTIVGPSNLVIASPSPSADGTLIAYAAWAVDYQTGGSLARVYVATADGETTQVLRTRPVNDVEGTPIWSNDGTRLLVQGCRTDATGAACTYVSSVVPANATDPSVDLDTGVAPGIEGSEQHWAPDDGSILTIPLDADGLPLRPFLSDPVSGESRPAPWTAAAYSTWQRLAP